MISIIVPIYNSEAFLGHSLKALESLKAKEEEVEIILVDDGSTDASLEVARRYPFQLFAGGENRGAAWARNLGARQAQGEILLFVDSDIVLPPDTIPIIHQILQEDQELVGFNGVYTKETPAAGFASQFKNLCWHYLSMSQTGNYSAFWSAILIIRRQVFLQAGGFNERFQSTLEDVEFGMRLAQRGVKFRIDPRLQGIHLKEFTFWSLLRSDFGRVYTLACLLLLKSKEETQLYKKSIGVKGFLSSCVPGLVVLGLLLSPLSLYFLLLAMASLGLYLFACYPMLHFFFRERGKLFGLGAGALLFLEMLVAQGAGMLAYGRHRLGLGKALVP